MKTVLIVLALIVVGGVVLGFYRGWFSVSSKNTDGKSNVMLTVDKDKIGADKDKAVDKVQDLGHKAADEVAATTQKAQK
jgi:hypothetical protein